MTFFANRTYIFHKYYEIVFISNSLKNEAPVSSVKKNVVILHELYDVIFQVPML